MDVKNTTDSYGFVARFLHWFMALAIVAMFALGWWMAGLDLYNPWYKQAPYLHESFGVLLMIMLLGRVLWRVANTQPDDSYLQSLEQRLSRLMHWGLYALLAILMICGYLISTLDGRSIDVLGLFSIPSIYQQKGLEETFGLVHEILAYAIIGLSLLHTAAALKHHFIDRDATLIRMWRGGSRK